MEIEYEDKAIINSVPNEDKPNAIRSIYHQIIEYQIQGHEIKQ